MGRRKIEIVRIENERHRQVTFTKRKGGLIKKATELAILCDAEVAVVIFGANQKLTMYSSGNVDEIMTKYSQHKADPLFLYLAFEAVHGASSCFVAPFTTM